MPMPEVRKRYGHRLQNIRDGLILLVMCGLLYAGASWQIFETYTDAARYQCYTLAFWQGQSALQTLPSLQCRFITHPRKQDLPPLSQDTLLNILQQAHVPAGLIQFVAEQTPDKPLHDLPYEYPLLTLLPFSLALLAPALWYQVAFAICMALVAAAICLVLWRWRSRSAALACVLYFVSGGWATVVGRFDVVPSLLTLLALIFAVRKRWNGAFMFLALATLFKFYPLALVMPFFMTQQLETTGSWHALRRWKPLGFYCLICALVMSFSLLLSVVGTLAPLSYFGSRPIQVESLSASLLWLGSLVGLTSLTHAFTFGSLNVFSVLSPSVSLFMTLFLIVSLLYTSWLQWRAKIALPTACLLFLLLVMITGKIFSPQYLIWVVPLVAYIGCMRRWWFFPWCLIGLLTTWIYPYIYLMTRSLVAVPALPLFYPVVAVRDFVLLAFILGLLFSISRKAPALRPCASVASEPDFSTITLP